MSAITISITISIPNDVSDEALGLPPMRWAEDAAELCKRQWKQPVFLTNTCCENAHGSEELFALLNLKGGNFNGEFYPLTDAEAALIAEDIERAGEGYWLNLAHTALYQGQKWLLPLIEIHFWRGEADRALYPDMDSKDVALLKIIEEYNRLKDRVEAIGGKLLCYPNLEPDRHALMPLIPFDGAVGVDHELYKAWLIALFTRNIPQRG